ncbi:MAG: hypothetical protein M1450_02870 [Patescibacteria group bacterium]|nr:hypothetical protein [Patescibacteria group bacterium]
MKKGKVKFKSFKIKYPKTKQAIKNPRLLFLKIKLNKKYKDKKIIPITKGRIVN